MEVQYWPCVWGCTWAVCCGRRTERTPGRSWALQAVCLSWWRSDRNTAALGRSQPTVRSSTLSRTDLRTRRLYLFHSFIHSLNFIHIFFFIRSGNNRRLTRYTNIQTGTSRHQETAAALTPATDKKLSCRWEAARYFVPLNISLTHSRSLKVIRNDNHV